jgi:hypothetical protein
LEEGFMRAFAIDPQHQEVTTAFYASGQLVHRGFERWPGVCCINDLTPAGLRQSAVGLLARQKPHRPAPTYVESSCSMVIAEPDPLPCISFSIHHHIDLRSGLHD